MRYIIVFLLMIFAAPVSAAEVTVEMLNKGSDGTRNVFAPLVVKVNVGDTVIWKATDKGHNVEMVASPNDMKFKSKINKEAKITFDTPGIYYYRCTPHAAMGMIGIVVVGNDLSNLEQIEKAKVRGKSKKVMKSMLESLK